MNFGLRKLLTGLLALSLLSGCVSDANYKVLSFFFDGVPLPGEDADLKTAGDGPKKRLVIKITQHGPYAAKMCNSCHDPGSNKLILPIEKLCLNCHSFPMDKKYVHGPIASGGCRVCHEPHSSRFKFLLSSESKEFCFKCHIITDVSRNLVHKDQEGQCTDCHDAHMSDIEFLLK